MKKWLAAWSAPLLAACIVGCTPPPAPPPPEAPPAILSFTSSKKQVNPGESVNLAWEAERATEATLTDQSGTPIATTGSATSGAAMVTPGKTSYYVLKVSGAGGRDTAFVQVAVGEAVSDLTFIAVPPEIAGGRSSELLWAAPGAMSARVQYGDQVQPLTGTTGVLSVQPARTTTYTLTGTGGGKTVKLDATVKVRPAIVAFEAVPPAAKPEQTLSLNWKTAGAASLKLTESTFGELLSTSDLTQLDEGKLEWKVPKTLASGQNTPLGLPLLFTLTVSTTDPVASEVRTLRGYVGDGPAVTAFELPDFVTLGRPVVVTWSTVNAYRITLKANGLVLLDPAVGAPAIAQGRFVAPAVGQDTTFELIATSYNGLTLAASKKVRVVKVPAVTTFNLPTAVPTYGDVAMATWTTQNASGTRIKVRGGATLYTTLVPSEVASGSTALYPLVPTTFVLEAFNDAGDVASIEKTVDVSTAANIKVTPTVAVGIVNAEVTWDLAGASATRILGAPQSRPPTPIAAASYVNLDAAPDVNTLSFATKLDAVARLTAPAGFSFPFLGKSYSSFYISTNGLLTFANYGALPDNVNLTEMGNRAPAMLAPFWDHLELGNGRVRYALEGTAFPRRLVIEWNKVSLAGEPLSELTFQLQLLESGEFRFIYKTLAGPAASKGNGATVGAQLKGDLYAVQYGFNQGTLVEDTELDFFTDEQAAITGAFNLRVTEPTVFTLLFRNTNNRTMVAGLPLRVFQPNAITLSEAMPKPAASIASTGGWVELTNTTDAEVDLAGLELKSTGSTTGYVMPAGTRIAPGGILVLGQSMVPAENGNAPIERAYTDVPLKDSDTLTLSGAGTALSTLKWTTATEGASVQAPQKAVDVSGALPTCVRKQTYGAMGMSSVGTPGKANEVCFEYLMEPIPARFADVSVDGLALFPGTGDEVVWKGTLAVPFPYFGSPKSILNVSSNGWLGFKTYTSAGLLNRVNASPTSEPVGIIAPLWDDLDKNDFPDSNVYVRRFEAGQDPSTPRPHVVVQWHNYSRYDFDAVDLDALDFEVKLFDDGVIEIHYGQMTSGNAENRGDGNQATVWIERTTGTQALFLGRQEAFIQSNTAYRFTPRQ